MLEWIYTGEIEWPLEVEDVIDICWVSSELQIKELFKRSCSAIVIKPDNVVDILTKYCRPNLEGDAEYRLPEEVSEHCV